MKIMIVDDNEGIREMIRAMVCREMDTVLECSGGKEAILLYKQFHPDYVLMDIEMKDMDGFTATRKIHEQNPKAKIIFVTNYNTPPFRAKAQSLHATGFISKENLSELNKLLHY